MSNSYHNPVLLNQSVDSLITNPSGIYVDCTFGGGGHSKEILNQLDQHAKLLAFDQDLDAKHNLISDPRFTLLNQNFRYLKNNLKFLKINQIDGVLADLGVSSHQFDTANRGFSIRFDDAPLDMRMNQNQTTNAATVLNEYDEKKIADILHQYGELRSSRKMAREIVHFRKNQPINTLAQLKKIFDYIPSNKSNKFFAQLFQAIRIEVNGELDALKEMLQQTTELIKPNGRLVVISYHSLEDRLVKRFMKFGMFQGEPEKDVFGNWQAPFKPQQSKVIIPTEQEINTNPRARSAKLRIAIKN